MNASQMGSLLRARREELGISLEMAATATNIRARVLDVIEKGDYANFPPYGHAMGMISSYARYLETDPRPILQQFEREWGDFESARDMQASAERTRRGVGRFGERVAESDRPSERGSRFAREGRRGALDTAGSTMHTKLDDERTAEEDDRYKSGTVKVVGHRQTGTFNRVGQRRPRAAQASSGQGRFGNGERSTRQGGTRPDERTASRLSASGRLPKSEPAAGGARPARESGASGSTARRGRETGSFSRTSSRYSRQSASERYTSRNHTGRNSHADDHASKRASQPASSRASHAQEGKPDYFSVEKLDRRERSLQERSATTRRSSRAATQPSGGSDNLVQRVVALVSEAFSERRTRMIAIGIAAFVLVVVIVAGILISTAGSGDTGVISVEGGAADTTQTTGDPNSASATVTTTNGNPVNVSIDVAEGQTSLINVTYDDDNAYSGTAVGAWHREFLVTESLEATFGNPDAVTVTENGNQVNIEKDSDGTGKMSLTIKTTSTSTTTGSSEESTSKKKSSKKSKKSSSTSSSSSESS